LHACDGEEEQDVRDDGLCRDLQPTAEQFALPQEPETQELPADGRRRIREHVPESLQGCVRFFDHFTHAAACPNATTEPCDITPWICINRDLFMATGRAHYLENIEFAFYNAFLAGVYSDGTWGAHSVRSHGTCHQTAPHQVGMKYHQCCIDNMPRTFADFADTVLTRGSDGSRPVYMAYAAADETPQLMTA